MSWDIVVGIVKHPPELRLFFDHISAEFLQIASTLEINPLKKQHVSNSHHDGDTHYHHPHLKKNPVQRIKTKKYIIFNHHHHQYHPHLKNLRPTTSATDKSKKYINQICIIATINIILILKKS